MPRIFETGAGAAQFPSTPRLRVVTRKAAPTPGEIRGWEIIVLVVLALLLLRVASDGIDLAAIPFAGWIHP